ncbi:MAG: MBL fold metallo-hydrolase [Candidatus Omnitrophota bacterium]|nr:MBL fold metallo-hydrolase [Candidatus Omnitrophota bacterium]
MTDRVVFYGDATFSLFSGGLHILCDPWFNAPSVAGAFEKLPPCSVKVEDIPRPDYLYISHIHSDHCEYETLEALDKYIPVILIDRDPNYLTRMLRTRGFKNLVFIPEGVPTQIQPGLTVETFGATYPHVGGEVIDSSVLFTLHGKTILNCNDNTPEKEFCEKFARRNLQLDLAFIPPGGGGSYPSMYDNLASKEKESILEKVQDEDLAVFSRAIDILKPKVVVPIAGGYAIRGLHPVEVNWQQNRIINSIDVVEYHQTHGKVPTLIVPLQPEMEMDLDGKVIRGAYKALTIGELTSYFTQLSVTPVDPLIRTRRKLDTLFHLLNKARANLWKKQIQKEMLPDYRIYFDVEGQVDLFEIYLISENFLRVLRTQSLTEPYLKISLDQDTLLEWLLGFEDFNMLDSGHRIRFYRAPNQYVQEVYYLMSWFRL